MPPIPAPASLQAFLRGIERRAFVLLLSQSGDADAACAALAGALPPFLDEARTLPLAHWPLRFWAALLRQPAMLRGERVEASLAALGAGPRAALLLRLVAGLDAPHAAQALGVSEAAHAQALAAALRGLQAQRLDVVALREQLHERARRLSDRQLAAIERIREQALAALATPSPAVAASPPSERREWLRRAASVGLVLLALAFAASFWWPLSPPALSYRAEPLPVEPVHRSAESEIAALLTDPDYEWLALPPPERALADDLALQSWWAAGAATETVPAATALPEAPELGATEEAKP